MKNIKFFFLLFFSILSSNEFEKVCKEKLIQKIKNQIQQNNENNKKNLLENNQLNLKLNFYLNENKLNKNNFSLKTIFEKDKNNDYFNVNLNNYKKEKLKIFVENDYLSQKPLHNKSNSYEKSFEYFKEKPILINNQNKKFEKIILTPRYSNNKLIINKPILYNKTSIQKKIDEKNWLLIKEKFQKNIGNGNIVITKSIILN